MQLLFVRHGETDWNASLRYQGQLNIPLNERGRQQAHAVAQRLATYRVQAIYSSDLSRAAETAQIIGSHLQLSPLLLPELREIDVGHWEGLTPEELHQRYPDHMREYERDPANTVRLGGESYAQMQARALTALTMIHESHPGNPTIVCVSHGGTIRALICHILGLDLVHFGRMWADNASLSELRRTSKGWRLYRLNDCAHLEGTELAAGE
ncbi:MAG: histidine phosphatase family protein [Roseiflexaceae bacterium]